MKSKLQQEKNAKCCNCCNKIFAKLTPGSQQHIKGAMK